MKTISTALLVVALISPGRAQQPSPQDGTATIRGRVTAADTGRPLRRVRVSVATPEVRGTLQTVVTDADGRYEIIGLRPGRYIISAARDGFLSLAYGQRRPLEQGSPLPLAGKQILENIDFLLPRVGVIAGRITDELGEPIANVSVFAMRPAYFEGRRDLLPVAQAGPAPNVTDATGYYRIVGLMPGSYYVMATFREMWTLPPGAQDRTIGYVPTYFPGTTTAVTARPVTVGIGQEAAGADFALVAGRTAAISGIAVDSRGRPMAGQTVQVLQEIRGPGTVHAYMGGRTAIAADGAFAIENVPPGEYKVVASGGVDGQMEAAAVLLTMDGSDVTGLVLRGSAGWSLSGTVVDENGVAPRLQQGEVRIDGRTLMRGSGMPARPVADRFQGAADWTFSFAGLFGPTRISAVLPDGWGLKSVLRGTRDITDIPIEGTSGEEIADVRLVVTDRTTTLTGDVRDNRGPRDDATVIVFVDDRGNWFENSRWIASARPDRDGRFRITGLPAGAYFAVAVDYVESGMWNDPDYLESIRRLGQRFTLGEAAAQTVSLKLATP